MGGAVSVHSPCTPAHNEFKELYDDKKAMNKLFLEIASFAHDEPCDGGRGRVVHHLDIKDKICLSEVLLFINRDVNPVFTKNLSKNATVIKEAFKFAIGPKASKEYARHEMVKKEFRKLVPALLLFTELYNIFASADTNIDDDRIFPAEFGRARTSIANVSGVTVAPLSEEEWAAEFKKIDANKNGYITFNEFAKYALDKIVTPAFYINEITLKTDAEHEVIDVMGSQVVQSTFLHSLSNISRQAPPPAPATSEAGSAQPLLSDEGDSSVETLKAVTSDTCQSNSDSVNPAPFCCPVEQQDPPAPEHLPPQQSTQEQQGVGLQSRLAREASTNCITLAISKSLSALQNAHNSSLI